MNMLSMCTLMEELVSKNRIKCTVCEMHFGIT